MSDTPQTDAMLTTLHDEHLAYRHHSVTKLARFARRLERSLSEENKEKALLQESLASKEAQLREAERDARRYRWFRHALNDHACRGSQLIRMGVGAFTYEIPAEMELDARIDAALASES